MKSLEPLPKVSALMSFDFDGTLHDPAEEPPVPPNFFERIQNLHREQAVVWGINTGRSLQQMVEGFNESKFPFLPDWLVTREREILFADSRGGWLPHDEWNQTGEAQIHLLFTRARTILDAVRRQVLEHTGAQWLAMPEEPAGIISRTEEEMEWIVEKMAPLVADEPQLAWQRNSIYLRFGHRDFQKGSSLSEVARRYTLDSSRCFAIGDSFNDLEMLDPKHAAMAACPGNAVEAVKQHVAANGGYVATAVHGTGVLEAIRHYFPDSN